MRDGRPALLYVGDALTPRHVALVLPGDGDAVLDVYDPATGTVTALDERPLRRAPAARSPAGTCPG